MTTLAKCLIKHPILGAEMTRILQKNAAFLCFLSVKNAFWRIELANLQSGLAG
jgi:hypothetical protein